MRSATMGASPKSGAGDSHCLVPPQVQQRVLEIFVGEIEPFQQKIGDATLEVGDGKVLVGFRCELKVLDRRFVVPYGGIDEAHVCENLRRIADPLHFRAKRSTLSCQQRGAAAGVGMGTHGE